MDIGGYDGAVRLQQHQVGWVHNVIRRVCLDENLQVGVVAIAGYPGVMTVQPIATVLVNTEPDDGEITPSEGKTISQTVKA